jgi:hypothetical protein
MNLPHLPCTCSMDGSPTPCGGGMPRYCAARCHCAAGFSRHRLIPRGSVSAPFSHTARSPMCRSLEVALVSAPPSPLTTSSVPQASPARAPRPLQRRIRGEFQLGCPSLMLPESGMWSGERLPYWSGEESRLCPTFRRLVLTRTSYDSSNSHDRRRYAYSLSGWRRR